MYEQRGDSMRFIFKSYKWFKIGCILMFVSIVVIGVTFLFKGIVEEEISDSEKKITYYNQEIENLQAPKYLIVTENTVIFLNAHYEEAVDYYQRLKIDKREQKQISLSKKKQEKMQSLISKLDKLENNGEIYDDYERVK